MSIVASCADEPQLSQGASRIWSQIRWNYPARLKSVSMMSSSSDWPLRACLSSGHQTGKRLLQIARELRQALPVLLRDRIRHDKCPPDDGRRLRCAPSRFKVLLGLPGLHLETEAHQECAEDDGVNADKPEQSQYS